MTAPRLEINLTKIYHNASVLVGQLETRGISVTGVTKAFLGDYRLAKTLLAAGIRTLGDSRIENIEAMRRDGINAPITLIRTPMPSQVERVVEAADVSFNTELGVIGALSNAACKLDLRHGVVLMVELGDLREGIMPCDLVATARETLQLPNIVLKGIGTNLACRSGVSPDTENMDELTRLTNLLEATCGYTIKIISGGNSSNLEWALGGEDKGRINSLRLGESILLGVDPLHRQPIADLYTDAITLFAEIIERKIKPSCPWGKIAQTAFGDTPNIKDRGNISQAILALGQQDIDPLGISSSLDIQILGASSDHLILDDSNHRMSVGSEIGFQVNYSALLRAMTSPFVSKLYLEPDSYSQSAFRVSTCSQLPEGAQQCH